MTLFGFHIDRRELVIVLLFIAIVAVFSHDIARMAADLGDALKDGTP